MKGNDIDLHTHSCYSDGEYTPNDLIKKAKKLGIKILSITDHDTLLGNQNISLSEEEQRDVRIIPGIELSAKTEKGRLHILGYNIDIYDTNLNKKMLELKNKSIYSVIGLLTQLKKDYDIIFSTEDIQKLITAPNNIGRPDLAKLLVKYHHAKSIQDAFDKYLEEAFTKTRTTNKGLHYKECIELVKSAGGIPVLAHPKSLKKTDEELILLVEDMVESGLEGIEAYHSSHTPEETRRYLALATKYNLLISKGSDYHGPSIKPDIELGNGKNNNLETGEITIQKKLIKNYK